MFAAPQFVSLPKTFQSEPLMQLAALGAVAEAGTYGEN
jgi:hypothetical protein